MVDSTSIVLLARIRLWRQQCRWSFVLLASWRGRTKWRINNKGKGRSFIQVEASWNVMAHAQKPDFVFRRNGWVHLNRRGRQFSRLLAEEVCATAVRMLDTPCSEVVWRVLATHSIRQFPMCHHISTGDLKVTVREGWLFWHQGLIFFRLGEDWKV